MTDKDVSIKLSKHTGYDFHPENTKVRQFTSVEVEKETMTDKDDWKKRWQEKTEGGFEVNLFTENGRDPNYPKSGEIKDTRTDWVNTTWTEKGFYAINGDTHGYNLVPVEKLEKPKKERLVAWLTSTGNLIFRPEGAHIQDDWTRVPKADALVDEDGEEL